MKHALFAVRLICVGMIAWACYLNLQLRGELDGLRQSLTAERQRTQEALDAAAQWKDAADKRLTWPGLPVGHCASGIDFRPDSTGTPTQRNPFTACQPGQDCRTTAWSEKGGRK